MFPKLAVAVAGIFLLADHLDAATHLIEPDDYAEGAVLNDVHPLVQLRIYNGSFNPNFPADFGVFPDPEVIPVTANENEDIFGGYFTSTGTKSFGHADIPFFAESRQLAMRFLAPASEVSIDFIGTNSLADAVGVLEIFSAQGALLDSLMSAPVTAHEVVRLSLTRPTADIGYARAFSAPENDPFGALDDLQFVTTTVELAGDYNDDGSVDAADYVVWRQGLGTQYSPSHYDVWRENFGKTASSPTATTKMPFAVPEPASAAPLALSCIFLQLVSSRHTLRPAN
jgi:hypothetical protein